MEHGDALTIFGITGDLAFKKIFPSLQSMVQRGALDVPVIGLALEDWDDEKLRNARLTLIAATRQVIANGLGVLGVSAPDSM